MLTGTLKRLIIMLALVGFVRSEPVRAGAARTGAPPAGGAANSAAGSPQSARRHRPPVEEGCRVPVPETPPPPASCS
jgi:hypothetical protein